MTRFVSFVLVDESIPQSPFSSYLGYEKDIVSIISDTTGQINNSYLEFLLFEWNLSYEEFVLCS